MSTAASTTKSSDNLRGIGLMILSMIGFTGGDSFVIFLSADLPVGQIMFFVGLIGGLAFATLTRAKGHAIVSRDFFLFPVMLRNASEIFGTICYLTALSKIDLSLASSITQATPLAVTLGAVLLLKEQVQWRRWSAILVGFLGVLIIIRPGGSDFEMASIWAVFGMFGLAMRDLSSRMVPDQMPNLRLSTYGISMLIPAGLFLMAIGQTPQAMSPLNWVQIISMVSFSIVGYWAITAAMRLGDVSVVAPFRYTRIIFALIVGAAVFGDRIDMWTLIGVAITIAAGLYAFLRERRRV